MRGIYLRTNHIWLSLEHGYPILMSDAILPVEGIVDNRRSCKLRGLISRDK